MRFLTAPFDPYPFILLNLVLSCLAPIQAPIIMMSQNRQEAKDRLRLEHDYRVNLKAELEVRHLNLKIDQLLSHQWQRLLEIQRIQTEPTRSIGCTLPLKVMTVSWVAYTGAQISSVPLAEAVGQLRRVPLDGTFVRAARALGICLGDGATPILQTAP